MLQSFRSLNFNRVWQKCYYTVTKMKMRWELRVINLRKFFNGQLLSVKRWTNLRSKDEQIWETKMNKFEKQRWTNLPRVCNCMDQNVLTSSFLLLEATKLHCCKCLIAISGFVTMAYLFFGNFLVRYRTPFQTQQSLFNMLLGKFSFEELIQVDRTLGAIFFMSYSNCMMLITMNIFVVILDSSVGDVNEGLL